MASKTEFHFTVNGTRPVSDEFHEAETVTNNFGLHASFSFFLNYTQYFGISLPQVLSSLYHIISNLVTGKLPYITRLYLNTLWGAPTVIK